MTLTKSSRLRKQLNWKTDFLWGKGEGREELGEARAMKRRETTERLKRNPRNGFGCLSSNAQGLRIVITYVSSLVVKRLLVTKDFPFVFIVHTVKPAASNRS